MVSSIVVIGSSNTDLVVSVSGDLPERGETVLDGEVEYCHGGKGANQAVAAARSVDKKNFDVYFIGLRGDDEHGVEAYTNLINEGVRVDGFFDVCNNTQSGMAIVNVSRKTGENRIIVCKSANDKVDKEYISSKLMNFEDNVVIVCQLETPVDGLEAVKEFKDKHPKAVFVLNAAPASVVPKGILLSVDVLIVNEGEARQLCNESSIEDLVKSLSELVPAGDVVITLGEKGVMYLLRNEDVGVKHIPAEHVDKVVDTTGAGDCFVGWVASGLARQTESKHEIIKRANIASSHSIQFKGAQNGFPKISN